MCKIRRGIILTNFKHMNQLGTMYAIAFDLDNSKLQELYGKPSWQNAYTEIGKFLSKEGFVHQQGSVYFGDKDKVTAITCVIAVQKLSKKYAWFAPSISDIQMLRIEENSDLLPAIQDDLD